MNDRSEELSKRTQKSNALIENKRGRGMRRKEIERRLEEVLGGCSKKDIETATTIENMVKRIKEMSKKEARLDECEKTRREAKERQMEDGRINHVRKMAFPAQCG